MVETIENDPDGKYNGHYKKTGLKEDIITCRATGLPIINEIIGGTDCDGHTLIGQLEHLQELGIHIEDHWVDGTYAALENIAVAQTIFGSRGKNIVEQGRSLQQTALSEGAWGKKKRRKRGRPSTVKRSAQDRFFESEQVINEGMRLLEPVGA